MSSAERSRSSNITAPCHNHRQQITSSRCPHESVVGSEELNPNMRTSATPPTRRKWANLNGEAVHQLNQFIQFHLTHHHTLQLRRSVIEKLLQFLRTHLKYIHTHSLSCLVAELPYCRTTITLLHHVCPCPCSRFPFTFAYPRVVLTTA